jgi:hypothetical protein
MKRACIELNTNMEEQNASSIRPLKINFVRMKTMKYFFEVLTFSLLTGIGVNAQQQVLQGSTRNYQVTTNNSSAPNNYTYQWSVNGSGNIVLTPTNTATDILWNAAPGLYTITLTETNGTCSTSNTFQVQVLGVPTLSFTSSTSNGGCANIAATIPLNYSGSANPSFYPLIVNYSVDGVAQPAITFNSGDPLNIPLSNTQRADRPAIGNYIVSVVLTSATTHGVTVNFDTPGTNTHTVNDIPEINAIIAN